MTNCITKEIEEIETGLDTLDLIADACLYDTTEAEALAEIIRDICDTWQNDTSRKFDFSKDIRGSYTFYRL
jgi:hypothetical protein